MTKMETEEISAIGKAKQESSLAMMEEGKIECQSELSLIFTKSNHHNISLTASKDDKTKEMMIRIASLSESGDPSSQSLSWKHI